VRAPAGLAGLAAWWPAGLAEWWPAGLAGLAAGWPAGLAGLAAGWPAVRRAASRAAAVRLAAMWTLWPPVPVTPLVGHGQTLRQR
jgi:hypothetical protein